jgi:hypothetical protein
MYRLTIILAAAASAALLLPAGLTGAEGAAELRIDQAHSSKSLARGKAASIGAAEVRINQELDSSTQLEFFDAPLSDVVGFLKDFHAIQIQIDQEALKDVGIDKDEPVTCDLKGISLRSALNLFLRQLDLAYVVQDEVLLITTPEELETRLMTKIYPVGDLLSSDGDAGHFSSNGETLVTMITSIVHPTTWDTVGGPGAIAGTSFCGVDMLIVSQTYDVHEQIDWLLTQIRATIQTGETPPAAPAATESDG